MSVTVVVIEAPNDASPIISNLLQKSLYELSQYDNCQVDTMGLLDYPHLDSYWIDRKCRPFLIQADGHLAGFALVHSNSPAAGRRRSDYTLAEFFVTYPWRRRGVARAALGQLTTRLVGSWQVSFASNNSVATSFFTQVLGTPSGQAESAALPADKHAPFGRAAFYFSGAALPASGLPGLAGLPAGTAQPPVTKSSRVETVPATTAARFEPALPVVDLGLTETRTRLLQISPLRITSRRIPHMRGFTITGITYSRILHMHGLLQHLCNPNPNPR